MLASYGVYLLNDSYDIDPLLAGLAITPLFFVFGLLSYRVYYETFERRGSDAGVRGIAFFFGIAFIIEVLIIVHFGVDQRSVTATYIGKSWRFGEMRIPIRQLVAFAVALGLTVLLAAYLSKTFMGTTKGIEYWQIRPIPCFGKIRSTFLTQPHRKSAYRGS